MLPFLKPQRKEAGIATVYRAPDENKEQDQDLSGLEAAAEDLMRGVHSNDKKLIISALKAAFEILDSMPHEEGPHEE